MTDSECLLFGRSELRRDVLRYLFSGAEREAHPSELARILGYTPQAVARELRRLEDLGIVASEEVGRALRYRIDRTSPLLPEIAYEAGYRACAGLLGLAGYRSGASPAITGRPSRGREPSWERRCSTPLRCCPRPLP